jgi:hypothetical protein
MPDDLGDYDEAMRRRMGELDLSGMFEEAPNSPYRELGSTPTSVMDWKANEVAKAVLRRAEWYLSSDGYLFAEVEIGKRMHRVTLDTEGVLQVGDFILCKGDKEQVKEWFKRAEEQACKRNVNRLYDALIDELCFPLRREMRQAYRKNFAVLFLLGLVASCILLLASVL